MTTNHPIRYIAGRRGFTLVEAMMAVTVLGIAAAGVLLPFSGGARVRAEGARRTLGAKLASDLVEKALNTPFDELVASYNYSESQGQVTDASGQVFTDSNYANFSRDVSCQYVYVAQEDGTANPKFILVTVRAYYGGSVIATVNRLVSR
jgi:prepilin-type N-terminal cleavage/methylation domain-containing protein